MGSGPRTIAIVGAGQAGGQTAYSLRQAGYEGRIVLLGEEPAPPYQRPPLSKAYLKGELEEDRLYLKPIDYYAEHNVELMTDSRVERLDLAAKTVELASGNRLAWDALVIATGARPRRLPVPGAQLDGAMELRTLADVDRLRPRMTSGARMVVVGAGYIGLEAAAVGSQLGLHVTVLEAMPRVLARVAGPEISNFYAGVHRAAGVDVRLGARLEGFEGQTKITAARLSSGEQIACDLALVGIGVHPNIELARDAGLDVGDGIVVGRDHRTSHPDVFAIGDCAFRPLVHYGREGRLESVHNAIEGGKIAAAALLGAPAPAEDVPWFWSDQYDLKLQTAGLSTGADLRVTRGDPASRSFAIFYLAEGRVLAVDAVNAAPEYIVGKKLVAAKASVAPAELADKSISMKDISARALS
ncbi:MAG: pyridine nucleotide-disulfide oxidoreductase [Alphaproteobacteria bacterium]|nr:pyridine nucleotide-disulfide oxidoreductase [Alphaproteobacteria bacterium]